MVGSSPGSGECVPAVRPDFNIVLASRDNTKRSTKVGVAWKQSHGGISISLSPGVVLSFRDCEDHFLTLWPTDTYSAAPPPRSPGLRPSTAQVDPTDDGMPGHQVPEEDDIPF